MTALRRLPVLALGGIALMAGLAAGLSRLGLPSPAAHLAELHGPLMVAGFFGTVIGIERAVASGRAWAWAAPLAGGIGTVLALAGQGAAAAWLMSLGSLVFLALMAQVAWRHRDANLVILALAAVAFSAATLAWALGRPVAEVVPGWAAFLVLTIFGERLELSRFGRPLPGKTPLALAVAALVLAGALAGWPLLGLSLLAAALWLWRFDLARFTVRQKGLTRYVALCLISGYVWLAAAGLVMVAGDPAGSPFAHDAALHALFLGFVFSMVFGHAPIILPAVLRVALPYRPVFYTALAALHLTLALRLGGDLLELTELRALAGGLNAAVIVGWILLTAGSVRRLDRAQGRA